MRHGGRVRRRGLSIPIGKPGVGETDDQGHCLGSVCVALRGRARAPAGMGEGSVCVPRLRGYVVRGSSVGVDSSSSCSMFEMPVRERT